MYTTFYDLFSKFQNFLSLKKTSTLWNEKNLTILHSSRLVFISKCLRFSWLWVVIIYLTFEIHNDCFIFLKLSNSQCLVINFSKSLIYPGVHYPYDVYYKVIQLIKLHFWWPVIDFHAFAQFKYTLLLQTHTYCFHIN